MNQPTGKLVAFPQETTEDVLTTFLRQGARQMLATAIEAEVQMYLAARTDAVDDAGHRQVISNGYLPARTLEPEEPGERVTTPSGAAVSVSIGSTSVFGRPGSGAGSNPCAICWRRCRRRCGNRSRRSCGSSFRGPDHASALTQLDKDADRLPARLSQATSLLKDEAADILAHKHFSTGRWCPRRL